MQATDVKSALETAEGWLQKASQFAAQDPDAARFVKSLKARINLCHISMLADQVRCWMPPVAASRR